MVEKNEPRQPTHRAYSVIRREGQDDFWLNLGLVFEHKDGKGFNIVLQALPLDGKIVCREITEDSSQGARAAPGFRAQHQIRRAATLASSARAKTMSRWRSRRLFVTSTGVRSTRSLPTCCGATFM
jgi:hypothetical protein